MPPSESRFTSQNKTTQERISTNTVGLVALSDFRKRRAEVLEQQEREVREAIVTGSPLDTPDRSRTGTPDDTSDPPNPRKKKLKKEKKLAKTGGAKLSFGDDDEDTTGNDNGGDGRDDHGESREKKLKFKANSSVSVVPRSVTKSALRREAAEREALRREFLARQEAVKMTEIAIPFVFYDGTDILGGVVRVKKGDFVWVFLDKSRKVGADLGVGEKANARREWARVGVDDLMMVRGNIIIPHHFDFLFFIMNKAVGPTGKLLFDYLAEVPELASSQDVKGEQGQAKQPCQIVRSTRTQSDIGELEGASDDPAFTKVVDRRWYERNKHIYPASVWQEFDPEKDYQKEVRRDLGGNTFFYS
ncbi:XAP5-domain-containing protein [Hypoxylon trugodes]|uniref:XAP5-domain-containing protein n=1 Tax=Hypoxylon trugodes TaxID=326681 RepID=UPI0021938C92|nr:XAP5-domain-containing protein [Hypoxylon trugodes]KAI1383714.1 XAP5-domain-containing protein [Hypoxylon trugodes]